MKIQESLHTDEEIAESVQRGNSDDFGLLISRYEVKILRYGRRFLFNYEDIEDAVQDTFIKAYTNIQSFNTSMRFSPWIYRIAHNTFINVIKKKGREPVTFFEPDTILGSIHATENPEKEIVVQEDRTMIEVMLEEIPIKYREPLVLYFFEEKDYKDIADIMRIPISTVGVRIKRGKERMQKMYQEKIEKYNE